MLKGKLKQGRGLENAGEWALPFQIKWLRKASLRKWPLSGPEGSEQLSDADIWGKSISGRRPFLWVELYPPQSHIEVLNPGTCQICPYLEIKTFQM